jgi:4-alpha-glucanotransferase
MTRTSGISVPLFSLVTSESWGVGEFPDFADMARWSADAGQAVLQILPILERPRTRAHPIGAHLLALDPTCIALPDLPDFEAIGGELAFDFEDRLALDEVRRAPRVMYREVRRLKHKWLRRAWQRFADLEIARGTPRARQFETFCTREAWWLDEYATFRALLGAQRNRAWWEWDASLTSGAEEVMARAGAEHHAEVAYRKYLQWVADSQWSEARRLAWPTRVFGDLPYMISANSADVWHRQGQFRLDATVGAPPDAFAEHGQDWGLPPWREDASRHQLRDDSGPLGMPTCSTASASTTSLYRVGASVDVGASLRSSRGGRAARSVKRWSVFVASGARCRDLGTVPDFVRDFTALGARVRSCGGSGNGTNRASRPSTRRRTRSSRWRPLARTTSIRWPLSWIPKPWSRPCATCSAPGRTSR